MIDFRAISLEDLAGFISEHLRKNGIEIILVGGGCVTVHSRNRYQSYDLDFVTYEDIKHIKQLLKEIGFEEKDRYFQHKECPYLIEFVTPPVAIGNEVIQTFEKINNKLGTIQLLRPEDCVKDRLAAYFYWNDKEALNQAIDICLEKPIDLQEIFRWAQKEGHETKYQDFLKTLEKA